jgi:hypothetical protein
MEDEAIRAVAGATAPIIIWTLRRTGGTNLGTSLFDRSPYTAVQQEPFNDDRLYGGLTVAYRQSGDEAALRSALREILAGKVLIKHCVETVPPQLSLLLAEEAVAAGYRHVFLYRQNALGRLLSLHFALRSGVWGRQMAESRAIDESIFAEPLPVQDLVVHEIDCRRRLNAVHERLCILGAIPLLVAFEQIYADADQSAVSKRLQVLLDGLGLSGGPESDEAFVAQVAGGEQGTRDKYARFVNVRELAAAVDALPPFSPDRRLFRVMLPDVYPPGFARLTVWDPVYERSGTVMLSGIILPLHPDEHELLAEDAEGLKVVERFLTSTRVAAEFPHIAGSDRARFLAEGLRPDENGEVRLLWRLQGLAPELLAVVSER